MKIKAISSFAYKSSHVEAGECIDIPDTDAVLVISTGRAVRVKDKPTAPAIETAEASPDAETAEAPRARTKK